MKRIGAKPSYIAKIMNMTEEETKTVLYEMDNSLFKTMYSSKNGYYYGHVIEAMKYYLIIKNHK